MAGVVAIAGFIVWAGRGQSGSGEVEAQPRAVPLQVIARAPRPQIPLPASPVLAVTAAGGDGLQMRLVATPKGAPVVVGPWQPGGKALAVPSSIGSLTTAGSIPGHVEVRDDSGATDRSTTLLLPPTPGTGKATIVRSGPSTRPYVALVFDDGLDETGVERIIDTLRRTKSGGSFCLNGINVTTWPQALAKKVGAAVAEGIITLCSHGWSHRTTTTTTEAEATSDLTANAATDRLLGVSSVPFYRPPYGALSQGIESAAGKLGYRWIVMWDVDPSDYEKPDAATLVTRVVSASTKGSIVVLHAINNTADALPGIIKGLRAKGLKAVTLTTMFTPTPGASSGSGASTTSTTQVPTGGDVPTTPGEGA